MNITQTKFLKLFGLGVFFIFAFNMFALAPSASAYTCEKSGPNGDGKAPGGQRLDYVGGTCQFMKRDNEANEHRQFEYDRNGRPTGKFTCTNGTVPDPDGSCYTYKPEYTTYKPTYDDGSAIPRETWDSICEKQPNYYGSGSHYNEDEHACEARDRCDWFDDESSGGGCRKIGDQTATPTDIVADTTKEKVDRKNQCDIDKGSWDDSFANPDGSTGKCNVTEVMCENKMKGEWKKDPATGKEQCEGGTHPDGTEKSGGPPPAANNTDTTGSCGRAKTILLPSNTIKECAATTADGKVDGVAVLMGILRFILTILTAGVGVLAVGSIAYASILYSSARDNASQTQSAIGIIRNTVIGLLLYIFMVAILNYLVPGGVIG